MKLIAKKPPPKQLEAWKRRGGPGWRPSYKALEAQPGLKDLVRKALEREQGDLCCYCMSRIPPSDIEHILPQVQCRHGEDVDYRKLLASCRSSDGQRWIPDSCNHKRGHARLRVSPLQPDCEEHFRFTSAGEIHPTTEKTRHSAAKYTIALLGLDNPLLTRRRANAISALGLADLSVEERRKLRSSLSRRRSNGQFPEFATALISVLEAWDMPIRAPRQHAERARRPTGAKKRH